MPDSEEKELTPWVKGMLKEFANLSPETAHQQPISTLDHWIKFLLQVKQFLQDNINDDSVYPAFIIKIRVHINFYQANMVINKNPNFAMKLCSMALLLLNHTHFRYDSNPEILREAIKHTQEKAQNKLSPATGNPLMLSQHFDKSAPGKKPNQNSLGQKQLEFPRFLSIPKR